MTPHEQKALELRALAEAASKGPWEPLILDKPLSEIPAYVEQCIKASGGDDFYFVGANDDLGQIDIAHIGNGPKGPANATYIAAASPAVILELLDRLASVEAELAAIKALEPVAWRYVSSDVWGEYLITQNPEIAKDAQTYGSDVTNLYALPQSKE